MGATEVKVRLPLRLYQQLKHTARLAECETEDVILSAIEATLPPLPKKLAPESAKELARMMMLDSEALRAIADAFLPPKRQRRFTTLLRKERDQRLSASEKEEWEVLKREYLRVSQNKAHSRFILEQRKRRVGRNPRTGEVTGIPPGKTIRFKPGKELQS
jgi:Bacterial DNA-binding protein